MAEATIELCGSFHDAAPLVARRRFEDASYAKDLRFMRTQSSVVDSEAAPHCFVRIIGNKDFLYRNLQPDDFSVSLLDDMERRLHGLGHTGIQVLYSALWKPAT
jgi:hypothetical protein